VLTGSANLGVAAKMPGTLVHKIARRRPSATKPGLARRTGSRVAGPDAAAALRRPRINAQPPHPFSAPSAPKEGQDRRLDPFKWRAGHTYVRCGGSLLQLRSETPHAWRRKPAPQFNFQWPSGDPIIS
jgi:hypothetical protein